MGAKSKVFWWVPVSAGLFKDCGWNGLELTTDQQWRPLQPMLETTELLNSAESKLDMCQTTISQGMLVIAKAR